MSLWAPDLWDDDLWADDLWEEDTPVPPAQEKIFCQYCGKMFFTDDDNVNYFFVSSAGVAPGVGLWASDLWADDLWDDDLWVESGVSTQSTGDKLWASDLWDPDLWADDLWAGGGPTPPTPSGGFKRGSYTSPKRINDIGAQILRCPVDPMPELDKAMEIGYPHPMRRTIR